MNKGKGVFYASGANAWDGHKYVCMDDMEDGRPCLVYTFGISGDISFEESMAARGCDVYAHDHTVPRFPPTRYKNIHLVKLGIGGTDTDQVKTLSSLLAHNGHTDSVVHYLKV